MHEEWNQGVVDNTIFLYSPPFAQVRASGSTPGLIINTVTSIEANTEDHDTDGMFSTSRGERFTIQTAGVYFVTASLVIEGSGGGSVAAGYIRIWLQHSSGLIFGAYTEQHTATVTNVAVGVSSFIKCSVGDTVSVQMFQNIGNLRVKDDTFNWAIQWVSAGETTP